MLSCAVAQVNAVRLARRTGAARAGWGCGSCGQAQSGKLAALPQNAGSTATPSPSRATPRVGFTTVVIWRLGQLNRPMDATPAMDFDVPAPTGIAATPDGDANGLGWPLSVLGPGG